MRARSSSRPVEASTLSAADHKIARDFEEGCTSFESLNRSSVENGDAPFPAGREAVRMFLRGSFPCVFFLAIGANRLGQCGSPVRNLWAVWGRFRRKQRSFRQGKAISARYAICAKPH